MLQCDNSIAIKQQQQPSLLLKKCSLTTKNSSTASFMYMHQQTSAEINQMVIGYVILCNLVQEI